MAIKKFFATKDNTITNGYGSVKSTRATKANMGAADIVEVYSLYGSFSTSSLEKARFLVQFDTTDIAQKRTDGDIPGSGSANFFLNLTNAPHVGTMPTDFTLTINAVSQSWDEGIGLDTEEYLDTGVSNWLTASFDGTNYTAWTTAGGDYHANPEFKAIFGTGIENLEVDVTDLVEEWLKDTKSNYGFFIKLTSSQESGDTNTIPSSSYYNKKFFARGSEYWFKRPTLEARWNSSRGDDRGNFYASSTLASSAENSNNIYLYNNIRGELRDIPAIGTGPIYVKYYSTLGSASINTSAVTGGQSGDTGIYSASAALATTASTVYDVWYGSDGHIYHTGSAISVKDFKSDTYNPDSQYVINVTNLRPTYSTGSGGVSRIRLYIRKKGWSPTIYTVATSEISTEVVEKVYYSVNRVVDNLEVIPFGTGSTQDTLMSYDISGSYADIDFTNFETGYQYEIAFKLYLHGRYIQPDSTFKFRVD